MSKPRLAQIGLQLCFVHQDAVGTALPAAEHDFAALFAGGLLPDTAAQLAILRRAIAVLRDVVDPRQTAEARANQRLRVQAQHVEIAGLVCVRHAGCRDDWPAVTFGFEQQRHIVREPVAEVEGADERRSADCLIKLGGCAARPW